MMQQDHQQQIGIAQRQVLSQNARQLAQLIAAPPAAFADLVDRTAAENPFLSVSRGFRQHVGALTEGPSARPSLFAHVLSELPMLVRKPDDLPIAVRLTEGLDERGFLVDSLSQIVADLKLPTARVETVLRLAQGIEPTGLFARSVTECLALQLRAMGELDAVAVGLLSNINGLAATGAKEFARHHGMDTGRVRQLIDLIARLSRNPAAAFSETASSAIPELQFERTEGEWTVRPMLQAAPQLGLRHAAFLRALEAAPDPETRKQLRRKWRAACELHKAAGIRDTTVGDLGKQLLLHQRTGLDSGFRRLAALTQREMAAWLSLHESSVSRMVRQRFALIEGKVVPLSAFFERPRAEGNGNRQTRSVVLDALRQLITTDASAARMTDLALTRKLAELDIQVSRRRLGKYRALLGFVSSHRRGVALGA